MNRNMLKSVMVKHGDNVSTLAEKLGISRNTLYSKMRGASDFTAGEMKTIRRMYKLYDDDEFMNIFFTN